MPQLNLELITKRKNQEMYEPERIIEIMKNFQKILVEADNFPSDQDPKDYKKFWSAFRGEGAAIFGLTTYLLDNLKEKNKNWGSTTVDME